MARKGARSRKYTSARSCDRSDLNFFHKLDLYQVNKTLLNLDFNCFSYSMPLIYYIFQFWGNNNLVHWFKNSLGHLVFSETWGEIELFCIPWIHQENIKNMQIIYYKIYVDSCYYTVLKFRKSFFKKAIVPGANHLQDKFAYKTNSLTRQIHWQDKFASFFKLDFIRLRVREHITANRHISYQTNSTWWDLKPTKSHCGISGKSVVIYNIYSPEGNYFRREEDKFLFLVENSLHSIK